METRSAIDWETGDNSRLKAQNLRCLEKAAIQKSNSGLVNFGTKSR